MRLKCIQRVYGHLAIRLDCPSRSFSLKENRRRRPEETVRLCNNAIPLNISIRVYCVCRIYRRTLPTPWIVRQRWFCSRSKRRPRKRRRATGSAGETVWFSFHGDPSPSCPLCKEYTAAKDEEAERYRQVASKWTTEGVVIENLRLSRLDCSLSLG